MCQNSIPLEFINKQKRQNICPPINLADREKELDSEN